MGKNFKMMAKSKQIIITLSVIVFVLIRLLFLGFPFWGLEYEDAFIYNDTGRFLNYSYDFQSMPFKCQSCTDGSYLDCFEYGSYGGHFLTIPVILSFVNSIFGYHYTNIFFLNLTFSVLTLILVYIFYKRYKMEDVFSLGSYVILLSITPFLTIFNTSGLAETISSFFVLGFIFNIYFLNEIHFKIRSSNFWLSIIFLFLAIATKRENLIMLVFMLIIPLVRYFYKQKPLTKPYFLLIGLSTFLSLLFAYFINLFGIENNESGDIGSETFGIEYLIVNLEQLFFAISNIRYWGITGFLFLGAIIFVGYKRLIQKFGVMTLILTVLYIIIYSTHYRSYYQVVYNLSHPFETLRYSTNYLPLILLFISTVLSQFSENKSLSRVQLKLGRVTLVGVLIALIINSFQTRVNFSKDEYFSRIQPVTEVLKLTDYNDLIISNIPIIFRCYANENQRIVDLFSLTNKRLLELEATYPNSNIYILKPVDMTVDSRRYNLALNYSKFKVMKFSSLGFELLKYERE